MRLLTTTFFLTISYLLAFGQEPAHVPYIDLVHARNFEKVWKQATDVAFRNLNYPEGAIKDGIEGDVFISISVSATGVVGKISVLKGVRKDLDEEALRLGNIIKELDWQPPSDKDGKTVDVVYQFPIPFKLAD